MEKGDNFKIPDLLKPRKPQGPNSTAAPKLDDSQDALIEQDVPTIDVKLESQSQVRLTPEEKKAKYAALLAQLKYSTPKGAAPFDTKYSLEVLKNGSIIDRVNFSPEKTFYVIGRSPGCDIVGEHMTFSRMHAIFQFVGEEGQGTEKVVEKLPPAETDTLETQEDSTNIGISTGDCKEKGLYIYDLNSTHGTFLNKNQLYPLRYYRLRVGHVLKFGNSSRLFVVTGPAEDEEEESDKTVTELLKERLEKDLERKRQMENLSQIAKPVEHNVEEDGVTWGMAEDAVEETDLSVNPFAADFETSDTNFDNPKKTLLGWFEREGYQDELFYDVREKTNGHFICRINLPLDGPAGAPVFAEVDGKGKKKEIVAQCALKACQLLDKYGVLRQSHREGFKRKMKDWEEKDYYSSDEDTYLDRTGSVEKKRKTRMFRAGKAEETKAETFDSLSEKHARIQNEIDVISRKLAKAQSNKLKEDEEVDPLDAFMNHLKTGATDIGKIKAKLKELKEDLKQTKKLLNIAAPSSAVLPSYHNKNPDPEKNSERLSVSGLSERKSETIDKFVEDSPKKRTRIDGSLPTKVQTTRTDNLQDAEHNKLKIEIDSTNTTSNLSATANEADLVEEFKSNDDEDTKCVVADDVVKSKRKRNRLRQPVKPTTKAVNPEYDSSKPEYSTWVPPTDQRGDGWTKLNEKFGY